MLFRSSAAVAMVAMNVGFLSCNTFDVPFGVPVLLNAFMSFGWQGIVVQLVTLVICTAVWVPFVLIANREAKNESAKEAQAAQS